MFQWNSSGFHFYLSMLQRRIRAMADKEI